MKGGRNRKTVAEHLAGGSLRPARHGDRLTSAAERLPKSPPKCPKELTGDAKELWRALVKELAGTIGPTDGPTLALLCVVHTDLMRSYAKLATLEPGSEEHGRLSRSIKGAQDTYAGLAEKFGLSPVDRERLPVASDGMVNGVLHW